MKIKEKNRPVILIADDSEELRALVVSHLSRNMYEVMEATNGQEAVAASQSVVPDLILMDLQMPVMDGLEAAQHIRQRAESRDVPIIFFSAFGGEGIDLFVKINTLGKAPIEYLAKPFKVEHLTTLVESLLVSDKRS